MLDFNEFVRKPFTITAVEITKENLEDACAFINGKMEVDGLGDKFFRLEKRRNQAVYPGFFLTKMGKNIRCYPAAVFREQFNETPATQRVEPTDDIS